MFDFVWSLVSNVLESQEYPLCGVSAQFDPAARFPKFSRGFIAFSRGYTAYISFAYWRIGSDFDYAKGIGAFLSSLSSSFASEEVLSSFQRREKVEAARSPEVGYRSFGKSTKNGRKEHANINCELEAANFFLAAASTIVRALLTQSASSPLWKLFSTLYVLSCCTNSFPDIPLAFFTITVRQGSFVITVKVRLRRSTVILTSLITFYYTLIIRLRFFRESYFSKLKTDLQVGNCLSQIL